MKLFTETYESSQKVKETIEQIFHTNVQQIVIKYIKDKNTNQLHESMMIEVDDSSISFDMNHRTNGIRFYKHRIPPLYIPSIHILCDIDTLFETLFGYNYIEKVIKFEKKMDEDGNVPVIIYFNNTLPRTNSLKDFYLEMYSSKYGYRCKLENNFGGTEVIHIYPKK